MKIIDLISQADLSNLLSSVAKAKMENDLELEKFIAIVTLEESKEDIFSTKSRKAKVIS